MPVARRRLGRRIAACVISAIILGVTAWFAVALWVQLPEIRWLRPLVLALLAVLAVALVGLQFSRYRLWSSSAFVLLTIAGVVWWSSIVPRQDRDWAPDVSRLAQGQVDGTVVRLTNVRDFTWRSDSDFDAHWRTERYDLAELRSTDLILSYWGMPAIAHVLISFGFADGRHLVFSVGIRQERGEVYSEIGGFFKEFELAFTAGHESDLIRLRTNIRHEDDYLYPLAIPPAGQRALFRSYVDLANDLARQPRFYNTLTANCTTVVFGLVRQIEPSLPLDWRLVLTGYLPGYVKEHDGFVWKMPLDALRQRAAISAKARAVTDADDFSSAIRAGQ